MLSLSILCKRFEGGIIALVEVGAVKIFVTAVEPLKKNERQDETQGTIKIDGFLSFTRPLNANVPKPRLGFALA
jgi:hypothetical protein